MASLKYRNLCLTNKSQNATPCEVQNLYKINSRIEGLNTTHALFQTSQGIMFLEFLASLKEPFGMFGKSEAIPVRAICIFLSDDAWKYYVSHMSPSGAHWNTLAITSAYVIFALLQCFKRFESAKMTSAAHRR